MKKNKRFLALVLALTMALTVFMPLNIFAAPQEDTAIVGLKTNDAVNPIGIDTAKPVFSWQMDSAIVGQKQTAYEIVVAKDSAMTQKVWDSTQQGNQSVGIQYQGDPLQSSTTYYWKVTVWDKDQNPVQSETASFEMGLLEEDDWSDSEWIQLGTSSQPHAQEKMPRYTIEADIQITQTSVSLLFAAADKQNYLMWQFNNKNGYMEFKPHYCKSGGFSAIRQMNVSQAVEGSTTDVQKMKIEVAEDGIKTYLNGQLLETIPVAELGGIDLDGVAGRLGFRSHSLEVEAGYMDNIVVSNPQGQTVKRYDFEDGVNPFDDGVVENGRLNTKYTSFETISLEKEETAPSTQALHYTVEAMLTCDKDAVSLLFSALDSSNFYMMQLNTKDQSGKVLFKPHTWKNGAYATYSSHTKDVTAAIGSAEEFQTKPARVTIDVTESVIVTSINGQEVDRFNVGEKSDQGTTGINPQIGFLGFRADAQESGTVDALRLTDYTENEQYGQVVYDYDFEGENPFLSGSIEGGVFHTRGVGILLPPQGVPTFRKELTPKAGLASARLYTAGLGVYDVFLDGNRVGALQPDGTTVYDELKPGYTHHAKRTTYSTYDVTQLLKSGQTSTLSAHVTSGWWSGAMTSYYGKKEAFRAQLLLQYEDGSRQVIGTDTSWRSSLQGPILSGDIYNGETFDANADTSYRYTGYVDTDWFYADENREFNGEISALTGPPVRVREDLNFVADSVNVYDGITDANENQYGRVNVVANYTGADTFLLEPNQTAIVNMGQNFAGWDEIQVEGEKGTMVTMRHGEMLNDNLGLKSRGNDGPQGSLYTANLRSAQATGRYILSGSGVESYHASTTFYGFQYLEITATRRVTIHGIKGLVVTSVAQDTGSIRTSNEDVNQLISNIYWGQLSNYLSVPTDCPQRDERKGWTADAQVFSTAASYIADSKGFLEKYVRDMNDSQVVGGKYDGAYPDTAPYNGYGEIGQLGWGDAGVIIPYNLYKMYGDASILQECYPNMQKFMDVFMASTNKLGGEHNHGDWLAYESNDDEVQNMFGVAYFAWDAQMMAEMAAVLGKTEDVAKYQAVYEEEKEFFQQNFVKQDGSLIRTEQTACLMALKMDLLPDENSKQVVKQALLDNIKRNGNKLQTGFLGTAIIMQTLSDIGASDVAYQLLLQRGNPSWLYSVDQGATTIWERWNSYTVDGGFGPVNMNSFNHYAYGAVAEWMYGYMAGIQYDVQRPGFEHILLQPTPDQVMQQVDCSYDSAYGKITSNWNYNDGTFTYQAAIPANTTATISVPVEEGKEITVNGKAPEELETDRDGLVYVETKDGRAVFEAVAGSYQFSTQVTQYCTVSLGQSDPSIPVMVSIDGGELQGMPPVLQVEKGKQLTIEAVPQNDVDYAVTGWRGDQSSEQASITVAPQEDITLTAQIAWAGHESLAQNKPVASNAGWTTGAWGEAYLVDGVLTSESNSMGFTTRQAFTTEVDYWIEIDLGADTAFNRVQLYPRSDTAGVNGGTASFPKDFSIQVKGEGETEYNTVASYQDYSAQRTKPSVFSFDTITARYVRLHVTKLGERAQADPNYDFLQLAEMGVYNVGESPEPVETDKTILNRVIEKAEALVLTDEFNNAISSVQESFKSVLNEAQEMAKDEYATQEQVDKMWIRLMTEIHKLGLQQGSKAALQENYDIYSALDLEGYIDDAAKTDFIAALEAAAAMLENDDAVQMEVDAVNDALVEAAGKLTPRGNKGPLQTLINSTADFEEENYANGWDAYKAALDAANDVIGDKDAVQADVDKAFDALFQAMLDLRFKADKSILDKVIAGTKELDLSGYTPESVEKLNAALRAAEAMSADQSLTDQDQPKVDGALSDLSAAIAGLTKLDGTPANLSVDGDGTITGATGSAKTGETTPIAMAMAALLLAGAAITIKKRKF